MRSTFRWLSAACTLSGAVHCAAQDWESFGLRNYFLEVKRVYADTAHDDLYVVGSTNYTQDMGISFYRYHEGDWDTLGLFDQNLNSVVVWNDTLIISGAFFSVNGDSIRKIAFWDMDHWAPYGDTEVAVLFKVIGDDLYALGGFTSIDGLPSCGIAKRVGGHWQPFPVMAGLDNGAVFDITYYQDRLVAVGNLHFVGDPYRDVMILNEDSTWSPVGEQGLLGGFSGAGSCAVYQGDLYVCGYISVNSGNAGNGIMRWDGNEWHDVSGGLTWEPNDFSITCQATWMEVHDGKLFVSSGCNYAGNVPAGGIATWDGQRWCGLGDPLPGGCMSFAFLNDTLYANAIQWNTNNYPNDVVRFVGGSWSDTCSAPTAIGEPLEATTDFSAWLGPSGELIINGLSEGRHNILVRDLAGRTILRAQVTANVAAQVTSAWPVGVAPGLYHISVPGVGGVKFLCP